MDLIIKEQFINLYELRVHIYVELQFQLRIKENELRLKINCKKITNLNNFKTLLILDKLSSLMSLWF